MRHQNLSASRNGYSGSKCNRKVPQLTRRAVRGNCPAVAAAAQPEDAPPQQQQQQQQQQQRPPPPGFAVSVAASPAELRAAGYLRACAFSSVPPDRSEFAARAHRRMKGDAEWETVAAKVAGTDEAYRRMRVACLVATIPDAEGDPVAAAVARGMDLSTKLPAAASSGSGDGSSSSSSNGSSSSSNGGSSGSSGSSSSSDSSARIVVGTLDVNIGAVLPAEELIGRLPRDSAEAASTRAYLSNVCVADGARRRGVALALLEAARAHAAAEGVRHLYVHVVADNAGAAALYAAAGFEIESEETASRARALARPRRLILHRQL